MTIFYSLGSHYVDLAEVGNTFRQSIIFQQYLTLLHVLTICNYIYCFYFDFTIFVAMNILPVYIVTDECYNKSRHKAPTHHFLPVLRQGN